MKDIGYLGLTHKEFDAFTATLTKSDSDMIFLHSSTIVFYKDGNTFSPPIIEEKVLTLFKRKVVIIAPIWYCEVNRDGQLPIHASVLICDNKKKCTYLVDYGYIGKDGVKAVFSFFRNLIPKGSSFIITNGFSADYKGRKSGRW